MALPAVKTALNGTFFPLQDHPVISRSNLQPGIISHETLSRVKRSPFEDGGSAISTTDLRLRVFPMPCCNLPFGSKKCKSIREIFLFFFPPDFLVLKCGRSTAKRSNRRSELEMGARSERKHDERTDVEAKRKREKTGK